MRCPRCFGTSIRDHVHVLFGDKYFADLRSTDGPIMQCRDCEWDGFDERFKDRTPVGGLAVSPFVEKEES